MNREGVLVGFSSLLSRLSQSVSQSVIQFLWLEVNREPSTYFSFTVKNGKNKFAFGIRSDDKNRECCVINKRQN